MKLCRFVPLDADPGCSAWGWVEGHEVTEIPSSALSSLGVGLREPDIAARLGSMLTHSDLTRRALGRVQLGKLATGNARRREITQRCWQALSGFGLELPFMGLDDGEVVRPAYHILPVLLPAGSNRYAFIDAMRAHQVQTSIHYPPVHTFSFYRERYPESPALPVTEAAAAREVTLPLYPGMEDAQIEIVTAAVQAALAAA